MSVGGRIIELRPMQLRLGPKATPTDVVRIWVADGADETCVYAKPAPVMPKPGDAVWWTSGRILFDGDKQQLEKVGFSFRAPISDSR